MARFFISIVFLVTLLSTAYADIAVDSNKNEGTEAKVVTWAEAAIIEVMSFQSLYVRSIKGFFKKPFPPDLDPTNSVVLRAHAIYQKSSPKFTENGWASFGEALHQFFERSRVSEETVSIKKLDPADVSVESAGRWRVIIPAEIILQRRETQDPPHLRSKFFRVHLIVQADAASPEGFSIEKWSMEELLSPLEIKAQEGGADAQFNLGRQYLDADGQIHSEDIAIKWLQLAADQEHAEAEYRLGLLYGTRSSFRDYPKSVALLSKAVEHGNKSAVLILRQTQVRQAMNQISRKLGNARKEINKEFEKLDFTDPPDDRTGSRFKFEVFSQSSPIKAEPIPQEWLDEITNVKGTRPIFNLLRSRVDQKAYDQLIALVPEMKDKACLFSEKLSRPAEIMKDNTQIGSLSWTPKVQLAEGECIRDTNGKLFMYFELTSRMYCCEPIQSSENDKLGCQIKQCPPSSLRMDSVNAIQ